MTFYSKIFDAFLYPVLLDVVQEQHNQTMPYDAIKSNSLIFPLNRPSTITKNHIKYFFAFKTIIQEVKG